MFGEIRVKYNHRIFRQSAFVLAVIGAFMSAGCSKGEGQKGAGQSLARVDGYELTVHQLNTELNIAPRTSANEPIRKSQALESLINRRLLVAEAERAKLDRDPEVMQVIARQKEQVLVQALLERRAAEAPKPTTGEVHAYYQANPLLFTNRKVYEMRQIAVPTNSVSAALREYIDSGKSLDEVIAWLDRNNVPYSTASTSHSTADLPQQIVSNLDKVGGGKPFVAMDANRTMIASLHLVKDTPVDEEAARPQIEQYLMGRRMRDLAQADLARLRAAAKIEYLDPSLAPARTGSKEIAGNEVRTVAKPDDVLAKGVSGLK